MQISTTFLRVRHRGLLDALELDVRLDELDRAVGAGRHRLRRGAGEPVDHRAAGDQPEQERRMQDRQLLQVLGQPVRQHHDDREDHRRRADDRRADQHRLRRRLERVAGAVVLLEQVLGALEVHVEAVVLLELLLDVGQRLDDRELEHRLRVVGDRAVRVDRDRHRAHAEEAERHEAEREHRRRDHQRLGCRRARRC